MSEIRVVLEDTQIAYETTVNRLFKDGWELLECGCASLLKYSQTQKAIGTPDPPLQWTELNWWAILKKEGA